jgi:hypothetical protein
MCSIAFLLSHKNYRHKGKLNLVEQLLVENDFKNRFRVSDLSITLSRDVRDSFSAVMSLTARSVRYPCRICRIRRKDARKKKTVVR